MSTGGSSRRAGRARHSLTVASCTAFRRLGCRREDEDSPEDCHVRFCESRWVRFPPATHPTPPRWLPRLRVRLGQRALSAFSPLVYPEAERATGRNGVVMTAESVDGASNDTARSTSNGIASGRRSHSTYARDATTAFRGRRSCPFHRAHEHRRRVDRAQSADRGPRAREQRLPGAQPAALGAHSPAIAAARRRLRRLQRGSPARRIRSSGRRRKGAGGLCGAGVRARRESLRPAAAVRAPGPL